MAEVIQFRQSSTNSDGTERKLTADQPVQILTNVEKTPSSADRDFEQIYASISDLSPETRKVLSLIGEAEESIKQAHELTAQRQDIEADDALQRYFAILQDLFVATNASEGLKVLVLSLFHSIANKLGTACTLDEVWVIRKVTRALRDGPFLSFQEAREIARELKVVGLNPMPQLADEIAKHVG